jgi:hypothetical protein
MHPILPTNDYHTTLPLMRGADRYDFTTPAGLARREVVAGENSNQERNSYESK